MRPLFLSPPRTRSTILYEMISQYVTKTTNLLPSVGHSEPFLLNTYNNLNVLEMHPKLGIESLEYEFTVQRSYKNNLDSVLKKLQLFKEAKEEGREYNFKATLNVSEAMNEFLEVFNDRDIILTLRKNPKEIFYSTFYAMSIGSFHARKDSYSEHTKKIKNISVDTYLVDWMVEMVSKIYRLADKYQVVYYEDIETDANINKTLSMLLSTDEWIKSIPDNPPIKVNNNYVDLIDNFQDLEEAVDKSMRLHF